MLNINIQKSSHKRVNSNTAKSVVQTQIMFLSLIIDRFTIILKLITQDWF